MLEPGQPAPKRKADRAILEQFIDAIFRYCDDGFLSLRVFYHEEGRPPPIVKSLRVGFAEQGIEPLVTAATTVATKAANLHDPAVFAPPIATFNDMKIASEAHLHEAPALSVECDAYPEEARRMLEGLLGPATVVVKSGGQWAHPDTGEILDRLHIHWRLSEPTREREEHTKLKRSRRLAAELVGSDRTAVPMVHPLRWPGSWHLKGEPKLSTIDVLRGDAEIHLEDALEMLEDAARLAGLDIPGEGRAPALGATLADDDDLAALAETIPNTGATDWEEWNRLGMAFYAASGGGDTGLAAFDRWSAKRADLYDGNEVAARWKHFHTSPPTKLSVGTLIHHAREADRAFRLPSWKKIDGGAREFWRKAAQAAPDEFDVAEPVDPNAWEERLNAAIAELNVKYFMTRVGSRQVIASEVMDSTLGRSNLIFMKAADFKLKYANRRYVTGYSADGKREFVKDLGTAWIEHRDRRDFDHIDLIPEGDCPKGVYNLWRGFGVRPAADHSDWSTIHDHLLDVVCSGNEPHFAWLMRWMCYCVQRPGRQAEVAVVLRGLKGTGKGMVGQILMRIFRDHAVQISNAKHLVGNFNQHLMSTLFLFLDEALWAGDKAGESILKTLVTEDRVMIEPKGIDSFQMPNRLKILLSSNADWTIPASADERRYLVLNVSDHRKGDAAYFTKLALAIDGPELPALLRDLLAKDISDWDHRNPPHTVGLNEQKIHSADSVTKFWSDCLSEGYIVGSGEDGEWPARIGTDDLYATYADHAGDLGERYRASRETFGKRLRELSPKYGVKEIRLPADDHGRRPRGYGLSSLEDHRSAFLATMNIDPTEHDWSEGAE